MREPIDIVNLRPGIAGEATHIAFLLTKVNSNLTAKELSDKSNPEGEKKRHWPLKSYLKRVPRVLFPAFTRFSSNHLHSSSKGSLPPIDLSEVHACTGYTYTHADKTFF